MTGATARGARESGVGRRPGTPPQTQAGQFKAKTMPWLARLVALLFLVVTACLWRMGAADLPVTIGGFASFAIWLTLADVCLADTPGDQKQPQTLCASNAMGQVTLLAP